MPVSKIEQKSPRLKIGLISPYDHAVPGGVSDHIDHLARQFDQWGHSVRIVAPCSDPSRILNENFIPMGRPVPVPSGGSIARVSVSIWLRPKIKTLLQQEAFDILHLHEPMAGALTLNALAVSDSIPSVYIGTFHSFKGTRLYMMGGNRVAMRYFRKLQGLIAVSDPAHQFISQHLPGNYEIIPNGIDAKEFLNVAPIKQFKDGMINILFLGRLEKRKGLRYLLRAYSRLKWDWPNLRLIIVGPGKPDNESQLIMAERNLEDVVFVGSVSTQDKARYYKTADIFCSPATGGESFGIVLLEAMAAGVPVVATKIEGYSSVITDGSDGLLVEPQQDDALASTIALLLKDQNLKNKLVAAASRTAQRFQWDIIAGRVMDCYQRHLRSNSASRSGK